MFLSNGYIFRVNLKINEISIYKLETLNTMSNGYIEPLDKIYWKDVTSPYDWIIDRLSEYTDDIKTVRQIAEFCIM